MLMDFKRIVNHISIDSNVILMQFQLILIDVKRNVN